MRWSIPVGQLYGIPVKVHVTLVLLLVVGALYIAAQAESEPAQATSEALIMAAWALIILGSVFLHELAHAMAARRVGVGTREIVLLPFGGAGRPGGAAGAGGP